MDLIPISDEDESWITTLSDVITQQLKDLDLTLEELVEFYDARDLFTGNNLDRDRNFAEGFRRLKASRHPEAIYVVSLFPGETPINREEVTKILKPWVDDPIALCYRTFDILRLDKAATLGHPYAMGRLARHISYNRTGLRWSIEAARRGDRDGIYQLGKRYQKGQGVTMDMITAVSLFKEATRLGHARAMKHYAKTAFSEIEPERYFWLGQSSHRSGYWGEIFLPLRRLLEQGPEYTPALFAIGRIIQSCGDDVPQKEQRTSVVLITLFEECIRRAREATMTWMLCCKRLGLYRDVAKIIGQKVWEDRVSFFPRNYSIIQGATDTCSKIIVL